MSILGGFTVYNVIYAQARTEDFLQGGVKSKVKGKPLARDFLPPLRGGQMLILPPPPLLIFTTFALQHNTYS